MGEQARPRVFVSAVSKELGSYREEVARVLRRKELEVRDQEHLRQGPATLLEQLRDYVEGCDAVVLLVGERCGAFPTAEHVAALGPVVAFDRYRERTGAAVASYTQWEYLFAQHYGKPFYVWLTGDGFSPDEPNPETAEHKACQAAFREWVKGSGKARDPLTTKAKLIEDVAVLPLEGPAQRQSVLLPYGSLGDLFKGRERMLEALHTSLRQGGKATAIAGKAVHGLGGVGKTRLAVEYAWRHVQSYSALLFVVADSPANLHANLAGLVAADKLDLPEQRVADATVQEAAVLRWLAAHSGWLLILDNVDDEPSALEVEKLLAGLHHGHVLLTGRLANWGAGIESFELDVLDPDEATAFLLARTAGKRRQRADDPSLARELAKELDGLALALEQAGAYLATRRLGFAEYLELWRTNREPVLAWFNERLMKYPRSLAITWQTSVDQLSPAARRLLERLAWLGPEPIPESLLVVPVPGEAEPPPESFEALAGLASYSPVTRFTRSPTITVHRLLQDVTRRRLGEAARQSTLVEALGWVNAAFVGNPNDVRTWPTLDPLAPHASAVVAYADEAAIADPTARLMNNLAQLLQATNRLSEAEPLMRRALRNDESSYGGDHPRVAIRLNNLAVLLQATNRLGEAEPLMRRAFGILLDFRRCSGHEHPEFEAVLGNLHSLLVATGKTEAEAEAEIGRIVAAAS